MILQTWNLKRNEIVLKNPYSLILAYKFWNDKEKNALISSYHTKTVPNFIYNSYISASYGQFLRRYMWNLFIYDTCMHGYIKFLSWFQSWQICVKYDTQSMVF